MRLRSLAATAGLALWLAASAAGADEPRSVEEILSRAIEAQARHQAAGHEVAFDYALSSVTEKLDGGGEVESEERELYASHHIGGNAYERLVEKDGRPLTDDELEEEQEREQEFREGLVERADASDEEEEDERVAFDEDLVARYSFERGEDELVNGRACFRLRFEPRPAKRANKRRIDRVLNKAHGDLWVDSETFEIARLYFRLDEKVRLWWGMLGSVSEMTGRLERSPIDGKAWLPTRFELFLRGRVLFRSIHFRQNITWKDFVRRVPSPNTTKHKEPTP